MPPAVVSVVFNSLRIPLALLFISLGLGVDGIWWAISASTILKGLVLLLWFIAIKKRISVHKA
jgi:Na+-driven multidrug efflux pump